MANYTVSYVEGLFQSYVGDFLKCKEKLVSLTTSSDPAIAQQAQTLLDNQYALEKTLTSNLAAIDTMKAGNVNYIDMASLVSYGFALKNQIDNTNALYGSGSGSIPSTLQTMLPYIIVGVGVLAGAYVILKK